MANYKDIKGTTVQVQSATQPTTYPQAAGELYYNASNGDYEFLGLGAGTWASGGSLNTARAEIGYAGIQTAALGFGGNNPGSQTDITEEYNGSSWTESGDLNTARREMGSAGTQTAALSFGGNTSNTATEVYNGSSWTNSPASLNSGREQMAGFGTSTAALCVSGNPISAIVEQFDGSSWTEITDVNTARRLHGGCGISTAGLIFGGQTPGDTDTAIVESWNGSAWTEVGDLNTAAWAVRGMGPNSDSLAVGGTIPPDAYSAKTESFNGTSWTEVADLATGRDMHGTGGPSGSLAIAFGGRTPGNTATAEEWTFSHSVKTVTTS